MSSLSSAELIPNLQLVPTDKLRFHEHPERSRTLRLMERVKEDRSLRNPPIVANMDDGEFLLLDGANRVSAFKELHYSHVPVQVVDYGEERVQLKGWHHLLINGRGRRRGLAALARENDRKPRHHGRSLTGACHVS